MLHDGSVWEGTEGLSRGVAVPHDGCERQTVHGGSIPFRELFCTGNVARCSVPVKRISELGPEPGSGHQGQRRRCTLPMAAPCCNEPMPGPERSNMRVLVAVTVIVMAAAELLAHVSSGSRHVFSVPVAAVLVTVFAKSRGMSLAELGLARSTWRRGAAYGLIIAGLGLVVVAVVAGLPWTRSAFTDDRYDYGIGHALLVALVYIPLRTVFAEELIFRGALLAAISRLYATRTAVIASSLLFGLWHVLSSLRLAQDNEAVASPLGSGSLGQVAGVLGSVLVTTVAGLLFCWLRLRSGSLFASIGAHWAVNGVGVLASAAVWTLTN